MQGLPWPCFLLPIHMTSTAHRPTAAKSRSVTHIADDLSVLKADTTINEALEDMHSDDPAKQASGMAQLQALIDTEEDLRKACDRLLWSAERDEQYASTLTGEIDGLQNTIDRLEAQRDRHLARATDKRIYAGGHLDHHFPDEKTHPTPFGNFKLQHSKEPKVVNKSGGKLGLKDIPPDYEWLVTKQEVTTTSMKSIIDEKKILESLQRGERFPFARFKKPTPRFY